MMRIVMICTLCTVAMLTATGQETEWRAQRWAVGVSTGDILHSLFNTDTEEKAYPAFVLEHTGRRLGLHAGFRPGYNKDHTSHDGFLDTEINESSSLSGSLALTTILFEDARWVIRAGLLYEGGRSRSDIIQDSGFDRITTRRLAWNAGIGPLLDLRLYVHSRISMGIQASVTYVVSKSEIQKLYTNFPDFDTTLDRVESDEVRVQEPATIFLRYHF